MLGIIGFEKHKIHCIIGVNPEERTLEQEIFIDMKVCIDFSDCTQNDRLKDTINYASLADLCTQIAKKEKFQLLETLAENILRNILRKERITWGWIRIQKPKAIPTASCAFVELRLENPLSQHDL